MRPRATALDDDNGNARPRDDDATTFDANTLAAVFMVMVCFVLSLFGRSLQSIVILVKLELWESVII